MLPWRSMASPTSLLGQATIRRTASALVGIASLLSTADAVADGKSETEREATELYSRGAEHVAKNRCDQALPLLERSYTLLESPNTELLIARCLRDTGSPEEA